MLLTPRIVRSHQLTADGSEPDLHRHAGEHGGRRPAADLRRRAARAAASATGRGRRRAGARHGPPGAPVPPAGPTAPQVPPGSSPIPGTTTAPFGLGRRRRRLHRPRGTDGRAAAGQNRRPQPTPAAPPPTPPAPEAQPAAPRPRAARRARHPRRCCSARRAPSSASAAARISCRCRFPAPRGCRPCRSR